MILQLGSVSESISVTAEIAQVQLESSEQSKTVDAADLDDLTLKGRDLFGYMKLVPGVIDTDHQPRRHVAESIWAVSSSRAISAHDEFHGGRRYRYGHRLQRLRCTMSRTWIRFRN